MRRAALLGAVLGVACGGTEAGPPAPDPGWMSTLPDATPLSALSIPGTHESAATYEPLAGTAKCQQLTLAEQLDAGVRYFDIRCHDRADAFFIYHGPVDEQQTFADVLATMSDFLASHPTEAVVMSVKEETAAEGATTSFEDAFATYTAADPALWLLGDAIPTLGAARGKIVLLRRFDAVATPLGIDASRWADNTTFSIADTDATLRVEDAYVVTSTDAKWTAIADLLAEAASPAPSTLYLDYTSGYQSHGGLPNIEDVSDAINPQLDALLADPANAHAHLGVLAMDLVNEPRIRAVVATNAR